jgi:hypothetical protein
VIKKVQHLVNVVCEGPPKTRRQSLCEPKISVIGCKRNPKWFSLHHSLFHKKKIGRHSKNKLEYLYISPWYKCIRILFFFFVFPLKTRLSTLLSMTYKKHKRNNNYPMLILWVHIRPTYINWKTPLVEVYYQLSIILFYFSAKDWSVCDPNRVTMANWW